MKMKPWECSNCGEPIEVYEEYEPTSCCNGFECGCYGYPINPVFCDACEIMIFGKEAIKERNIIFDKEVANETSKDNNRELSVSKENITDFGWTRSMPNRRRKPRFANS